MEGEIAIYPPPRAGLPFIVAHVRGGKVTMLSASWDRPEAHRQAIASRGIATMIEANDALSALPKVRAKVRGHR